LTGFGRLVAFAAGRLFSFSFANTARHGRVSPQNTTRTIFSRFHKK
jgi:hypothetical protein